MSCKPLSRELAHTTLQEYGPMTKADLLDLLGDKGKTAAQAIFTARSDYPGQYFHIVGYEPQRGRRGREMPIYAAGPGPDAPRPNFNTKAAKRARQDRYYQNNRAQIIARTRARRAAEKPPLLPDNQWLALLAPTDRRSVLASARMTVRNQAAYQ